MNDGQDKRQMDPASAAPDSVDGFRDAVRDRYPDLSGQLQRIARFALDSPDEIALGTVTALAEMLSVQPSSMVRFAKSFGYAGFSDLQRLFKSQLIERSESYADRIRKLRDDNRDSTAPGRVLAGFVESDMAALTQLGSRIRATDLERAVAILANAGEVYLLAQRRAFPVAFYLSYALSRLGRRTRLIDGVGGLIDQQVAQIRANDALVVVSFQPYTPVVVEIASRNSAASVPIVAITDSPVSPLSPLASVSFEVAESQNRAFRSLVAPICLAEALVVSLGHALTAASSMSGDSFHDRQDS